MRLADSRQQGRSRSVAQSPPGSRSRGGGGGGGGGCGRGGAKNLVIGERERLRLLRGESGDSRQQRSGAKSGRRHLEAEAVL